MRDDIARLLPHIDIPETEKRFGSPESNSSMVVVKCHHCGAGNDSTVILLKNRIRRSGKATCSKCSGRLSWNDERRSKNDEYWTDARRSAQGLRTKETFSRTDVREKHLDGCRSSYVGEAGQAKKDALSKASILSWSDPAFKARESKRRSDMWKDPAYRETQSAFRTEEFRLRASQTQKMVWEDPEYALKASVSQSRVWERPGYRQLQSHVQKDVWASSERREKASEVQKSLWQSPERREKFEDLWKSDSFRQLMSESGKKPWADPDFISQAKERARTRWEDDEYRNKIVSSIKKRWEDPEYRRAKVLQGKTMWDDPEYRKNFGLSRSLQMGRASSLEIVTSRILDSFSLHYETQKPVGPYVFDFFVPEQDVFIECQGEYWHSLPGRQAKDAAKLSYLEQSHPRSRMLYLNERDFMNPASVSAKISTAVFGTPCCPDTEPFDLKDVTVDDATRHESRDFLNSFHYAGHGRGGKLHVSAKLGGKVIAMAKFAGVVRNEVATSMGSNPSAVLELDRFCIHPSFHRKNFASWTLSRAVKMAFSMFPHVQTVVSFADMTYGHFGTIYKASNWTELGKVKPDYSYVDGSGFIMHKKTLYNRAVKMGMTESEYATKHGYSKVVGREKTKFAVERVTERRSRVSAS